MRSQRGSALITVVLVVFVLTMVGIAALFYMQTEDRISGTDRLQKAAFYAAETGIREGEQLVLASAATSGWLSDQLARATANPLDPPGGGYQGIPLTDDAGLELLDQPLPQGQEGYVTNYSLYLRNNQEDLNRVANADSDFTVNILAVGTVTTPTGLTVRKVIEEQMFVGGASGSVRGYDQKGANQGSTGTIGGG